MRGKESFLWSKIALIPFVFLVVLSYWRVSNFEFTADLSGPRKSAQYELLGQRGSFLSNGRFAPSRTLLIDPVLVYSTYLGGASLATGGVAGGGNGHFEQGVNAMFVDTSGNVYVGGSTSAANFPVTAGVVQASNSQNNTVGFLSKIDPSGQSLIFSTYLAGMQSVASIALDASGNIYVVGDSPLGNIPQTALPIPSGTTPFDSTPRTISIEKLNGNATAVLNATYFGGSGIDLASGITFDGNGNVYIAGVTTSNDFPTRNPIQSSLGSSGNVFVVELNPSLSTVIYSTYLGQNSTALSPLPFNVSVGHGIAVDAAANAYIVAGVGPGFPTASAAAQGTCATSACPLLAKLSAGGSSPLYATYLGSTGMASAVAVDGLQNAYVAGTASFTGFPALKPLQPCSGTALGGFVSEISAAGTLRFSTCLGEQTNVPFERGVADLVLDGSGNVYVVGSGAGLLPLKNPIQSNIGGLNTLFVAAIDPKTPSFLFSSLLGGAQSEGPDYPASVGVDANGNIYAAGFSTNDGSGPGGPPSFPVFNALQPVPAVATSVSSCIRCVVSDGFVLKISPTNAPAAALTPALVSYLPQQVGTTSSAQAVTILNMGSAPLTVSNVAVTGDFSAQSNCGSGSIAPAGGTCTIQVTFTPTTTGNRTGTLTITDNSAGSPRQVLLTGQGGQPTVSLFPATLSFPDAPLNTTLTLATTLTDTGSSSLHVSSVGLPTGTPFSETNDCAQSVAPGQICNINVTFAPTALGDSSATMTITDDAPDSPQAVQLSGKGIPANLGLSYAPSSGPISVSAGGTGMALLEVGGRGIAGPVTLTCSGAPTGAISSLMPSSVQMSATVPTRVEIDVSTTARASVSFLRLGPKAWPWVFAVVVALILGTKADPSSLTLYRRLVRLVPSLALVLCACGGGGGSVSGARGTPAGNYTLVVTAQAGSITQSFNVTLVVQ